MFSLSAAVLATAFAVQAPPPDSVAAFVNVTVIPMDREQVLAGQTVVVRSGRITAIGPADRVAVPAGATRIDGKGKFLLPGLGDMHAHSIDLAPYLSRGVTTIRLMNGEPSYTELRNQIAKGQVMGPRIYTSGPMIGHIETPDEAKQIVAENKAEGYDLLKLRIEGDPIDSAVFDTFVAAAKRAGLPWSGHSPWGIPLPHVLAAKPTSLEHLYSYLYTAVGPSGAKILDVPEAHNIPEADLPAAAAATQRSGVWNCPTLGLFVKFGGEPGVLERQMLIVKLLYQAGAGLVLGTDDAVEPQDELAALVQAGLTPYAALETGTRNIARMLNTLDSTGTVEVGKRADLILLSANPLIDVRKVAEPAGVMLGGRWLPRERLDAYVSDPSLLERPSVPPGAASTPPR